MLRKRTEGSVCFVTDLAWHWAGVAGKVTDAELAAYLTRYVADGYKAPEQILTETIPVELWHSYAYAYARWLDVWDAANTRPVQLSDTENRATRRLTVSDLQHGWTWLPYVIKYIAKTPNGLGISEHMRVPVTDYDRIVYACRHGKAPRDWQPEGLLSFD